MFARIDRRLGNIPRVVRVAQMTTVHHAVMGVQEPERRPEKVKALDIDVFHALSLERILASLDLDRASGDVNPFGRPEVERHRLPVEEPLSRRGQAAERSVQEITLADPVGRMLGLVRELAEMFQVAVILERVGTGRVISDEAHPREVLVADVQHGDRVRPVHAGPGQLRIDDACVDRARACRGPAGTVERIVQVPLGEARLGHHPSVDEELLERRVDLRLEDRTVVYGPRAGDRFGPAQRHYLAGTGDEANRPFCGAGASQPDRLFVDALADETDIAGFHDVRRMLYRAERPFHDAVVRIIARHSNAIGPSDPITCRHCSSPRFSSSAERQHHVPS